MHENIAIQRQPAAAAANPNEPLVATWIESSNTKVDNLFLSDFDFTSVAASEHLRHA